MKTYLEFADTDYHQLESDWMAWWNGETDRSIITLSTLPPDFDDGLVDDFLTQFPLDMPVDAVLDRFEPRLRQRYAHANTCPKWWINFGAGIMAAYLGSGVHYATSTTWFWPLADIDSLADMHLAYDANNVWWQRTLALTQAAVERWGDHILIAHTDLGGNLDILASLRGTEQLLMDLYDAPDEVERLVGEITDLWLRYYDELYAIIAPTGRGTAAWAPPWSPTKGYMLQSDFCYMISPGMFERFVLPDLVKCSEWLDYPFYHMDGKGQLVHLDLLLSIEKLRGIQWQPGDGQPRAEDWLDVLRCILDGGKLCQVFVTRDGAWQIARALGSKGFLFDIIEEGLTPEEAETFVAEFRAAGY